jgi:hypothetical protein
LYTWRSYLIHGWWEWHVCFSSWCILINNHYINDD